MSIQFPQNYPPQMPVSPPRNPGPVPIVSSPSQCLQVIALNGALTTSPNKIISPLKAYTWQLQVDGCKVRTGPPKEIEKQLIEEDLDTNVIYEFKKTITWTDSAGKAWTVYRRYFGSTVDTQNTQESQAAGLKFDPASDDLRPNALPPLQEILDNLPSVQTTQKNSITKRHAKYGSNISGLRKAKEAGEKFLRKLQYVEYALAQANAHPDFEVSIVAKITSIPGEPLKERMDRVHRVESHYIHLWKTLKPKYPDQKGGGGYNISDPNLAYKRKLSALAKGPQPKKQKTVKELAPENPMRQMPQRSAAVQANNRIHTLNLEE